MSLFLSAECRDAVAVSGRSAASLATAIGDVTGSAVQTWLRGRPVSGLYVDRVHRLAALVGVRPDAALSSSSDGESLVVPNTHQVASVSPGDTQIVAASVSLELLDAFDDATDRFGLSGRAEALRRAMRGFIAASRRQRLEPV